MDAASRDLTRSNRAIAREFGTIDRLLVPTEQEWLTAGQVLPRYARRHGALKPSQHVADLLIALGAARVAGEVVTDNLVDFRRWARALRQAGQSVWVSDRV